jgi:hypothetical protein
MWIKCTDQHDKPTLINLNNVVRIGRYHAGLTTLFVCVPYGGDQKNTLVEVYVKEPLEQLEQQIQKFTAAC